jgi:hypothetical protein
MANTLRIKRRSSAGAAGAPTSLENAELAFNEADNVLYYGTGTGGAGGSATSVIAIGGYGAYTTLGTNQTITGNKTFSGTVIVPTPSANTHAATKAYVDSSLPTLSGTENQIVYNAGTISLAANITTPGNLTVTGDLTVQGNTTTLNTATLVVEDKNIVLANVATPTDTTADGAGITIKGATDKTLNWVDATDAWTSSEHFNIVAGKSFYIGGSAVLSNTTLASSVITSSLTSVGTIGTGVWQGTAIGIAYGGTGSTTAGDARTALGLAIGTDVQAFSSQLTALAANTATIDGGTF